MSILHSRLVRARVTSGAVVATVAVGLALGTNAAAAAEPVATASPGRVPGAVSPGTAVLLPRVTASVITPTREAVRVGVTAGDAFMGWRERGAEDTRLQSPSIADTAGSTDRAAAPDATSAAAAAAKDVVGMDVSRWQHTVNWSYWKSKGKTFAFVKATEGTSYRNAYYSSQFAGSAKVGMKRGAYHYALPNRSSGSTQARFFVAHGGKWKRDGRTLPGVLDIEYNPYGSTCYGLSDKQMVAWIKSFTRRYKSLTGRDAVIYTTTNWWTRCTGNSRAFHRTNPLWIARFASSVGKLPGGWTFYTFWQYTSKPLDQDRFSGKRHRLTVLANG